MIKEVQRMRKRKTRNGYLAIAKDLSKKYGRPTHQKSVFRWAKYDLDKIVNK